MVNISQIALLASFVAITTGADTDPLIVNKGGKGCSSDKPCKVCEGDCDTDDDCEGPLLCFKRDLETDIVPGCKQSGSAKTIKKLDYCYDPANREDCVDNDPEKCPGWAKDDQCTKNPDHMTKECRLSCKICSNPNEDCVDNDPKECPSWAKNGECTKNSAHMTKECRLSCKICSNLEEDCADVDPESCPKWESSGECTSNAAYMKVNCRKSCKICILDDGFADDPESLKTEECVDKNIAECPEWAAREDECTKAESADFMKTNCRLSCNLCSDGGSRSAALNEDGISTGAVAGIVSVVGLILVGVAITAQRYRQNEGRRSADRGQE